VNIVKNETLSRIKKLPNGARFYKCALQVNPFAYLQKNKKKTTYQSEEDYNNAIVDRCVQEGIEVIAITDHHCIDSALNLIAQAHSAGIIAMPGFEAGTKDGVHILCIFDPDRSPDEIRQILGSCGVTKPHQPPVCGDFDTLELLEKARHKWNAACIAAHVGAPSGLLYHLKKQPAVNAWTSDDLFACAIPGAVDEMPDNIKSILLNKDPQYHRQRKVAIVNAQDVNSPEDLSTPGATCWIKMQSVSIEGLRQAFLDPDSRIRLASDPIPDEHLELIGIAWQGGFLDSQALHFNENLNVLIGGRGTGKSTIVESLRYVLTLEPLGQDARTTHDGIIKHVLRNGTKISVFLQAHRPAKRIFSIERTIPNPPVVRDENGQVLNTTPRDLLPQIEVYGQHEISELTKSPEKLTHLLERFVEYDAGLVKRKSDLARALEKSRSRTIELRRELQAIKDQLATLPALEETLVRFQQAGLEEKLKQQSLLVREERILNTVPSKIQPVEELVDELKKLLPIDKAFLSDRALEDLPDRDTIKRNIPILESFEKAVRKAIDHLVTAVETARSEHQAVLQEWDKRKTEVRAEYERILRELQKGKVDGEEFIRLRKRIEELRPLKEKQATFKAAVLEAEQTRRQLLAEWNDVTTSEYDQLSKAARRISSQLERRVQVAVDFQGEREPLYALMRDRIGGRLQEVIDQLQSRDAFSLKEFADTMRAGTGALQDKFHLTHAQAERLAAADEDVKMQIEELQLGHTTNILLNTAPENSPPSWQSLDDLSTGQKATAVLLLLLLESDAPLIVDQPEDDLDNRFITEGIVPRMRDEKRRRQFIFATHNANIPVLGDAELIAGLVASGEAAIGHASITSDHMGSIDTPTVRELVGELLEGGKEAFETRRLKYGY